ncbi:hypothetical protein SCALIN_C20_0002 [Candidatus Scalindua japonica]|uniref:Polysaccharide pyruvyl transferase domain-containing protein n=1 Tax=Candidatus Scalindua japonica TaxID=1284222 RepID=A0A286TZB3_9BACT|nr:polysaccharide pyruvyl transferase family protein [Candidatus Scalindua japonica]GAX61225.1 hypothetical protein SCALIN_C20_0002 [Candidatus Scalindua japonica]
MKSRTKIKKVCILGAVFNTNNMGVGALTYGSIKCITSQFPNAEITLLGYGEKQLFYDVNINDKNIKIQLLNMRFSKKLYLLNNVVTLNLIALIIKLIPINNIKNKIISSNIYLRHISESGIIASIAGGDSFSDIYGIRSLLYVSLPKLLVLFMGKDLILLPQTLGPFKSRFAKELARYILNSASVVYSRDYIGLKEVKELLGSKYNFDKLRFCYDVGFVLDPVKPDNINIPGFFERSNKDKCTVGLNISGLLYAGGYTQNNMFGLKVDYKELVCRIIDFMFHEKDVNIILLPHVFGSSQHLESDSVACENIYNKISKKYEDKLFLVKGEYNQNEIKYIIGLCDFFIGSRMHACIAALSQNIPPVSIAYSKKFLGVMQTIGVEVLVADPRKMCKKDILNIIDKAYEQKDLIREQLKRKIPKVKDAVINLFKNLNG